MYIKREAEAAFSEKLHTPKVAMVLGARQVGKTTLVKHALALKKTTFLNLDIDVDKQRLLLAGKLSPTEALKSLGSPEVLAVDEAQRLPEVGRIVKGWYDSSLPVKVVLLGSSSLNLLDQSAESLTGRNEKLFLTPLTFNEILSTQNWFQADVDAVKIQEVFAEQLQSILIQTLVYGSYPEVVTTGDKASLLQNLVSDYLLKDIFSLGLVKTPDTIRRLLTLLAYQLGGEVSTSELASNLGISRATVERYLDLLEQTFVIFRLPAFSTRPRREVTKSKKIYFWDIGVRNALINELALNPSRSDIGALWENWVVAEFAKHNLLSGGLRSLFFWRSHSEGEVDLVVKENGKLMAFEIKWSKKGATKTSFSKRYNTPVKVISSATPILSEYF